MNKEEILKKAQEEQCDEMEEMVSHKAMHSAWAAVFWGSIILRYVSDKKGLPTSGYSLLISIGFLAGCIYTYLKTKQKLYLWGILLWSAMTVWDLVHFIQGY